MKLYLSSYRIPTPDKLSELLGEPLGKLKVALIPNAKDYYAQRARDYKLDDLRIYFEGLGLDSTIVDLRRYDDSGKLAQDLKGYHLVWACGGNTFCLRYEMKRSGFDKTISQLLDSGIAYGGDSAGALVAGISLEGIERDDPPQFAEQAVFDGLGLVPYVILPHVDNPVFAESIELTRKLHSDKHKLIELKDSQAVVFEGDGYQISDSG